VTPRTRVLAPVDYAGHPAALDRFMELAERSNLLVVEDASHASARPSADGASDRSRT
jgi:dTDP-4-amino-4,6-dideoxygalactose transaminase